MKFNIQKAELLKGLSRVQGVVAKSNTMPILSCILLAADDKGIVITATDLEVGIRGRYAAEVEKPGAITVSAQKLYQIVRELPEDMVRINVGAGNWVSVKSGTAKFKLLGFFKDEYPQFPDTTAATIVRVQAGILLDMIKKSVFAAGENDGRYILNGVLVEMQPKGQELLIRMVATDGHRMAMVDRSISAIGGDKVSFVVPKKGMAELKKLLDEVETETEVGISSTKNTLIYQQNGTVMVTKLLDGQYPNYHAVVPAKNDKRISAPKDLLAQAFKRVAIMSKEGKSPIKLRVQAQSLDISTNNPDVGEAREAVTVDYNGAEVEIGFNASYLLEALSGMADDKVTLNLNDAVSPCLITTNNDPGYKCVVMPMRV